MAEQLLHHLGVDTETEQECGCAVAQIMKTNVWQFRFLQELLELIDHMVGSEMRTRKRAENVIMFLPECVCLEPGLLLTLAMLLQGLESQTKQS